jgi:hypothetical protein
MGQAAGKKQRHPLVEQDGAHIRQCFNAKGFNRLD